MKCLHNSFFFLSMLSSMLCRITLNLYRISIKYIYPLIELSFFSYSTTTCASRASHNFGTHEHQTLTDISIVPKHIVGLLS